MQYFFPAGRLLVYTNLFIAACAAALTWETMELLHLPSSNWPCLVLIFSATCLIYNLHYYRKIKNETTDNRVSWIKQNKIAVQVIMVLAAIIVLLVFIYKRQYFFPVRTHAGYSTLLLLGLLFVVSLAYSHVLVPGRHVPLRFIGWLKVSLLSLVWTISTVMVPVLLAGDNAFAIPVLALFIHRLFFMVSLVLLFNIRDYQEDKAAGIKTIAVVAGTGPALKYGKWITGFLNIASTILLVSAFHFSSLTLHIALTIPVILVYLLYQFFKEREEAAFILCNDGVMLLKALLLIFALHLSSL